MTPLIRPGETPAEALRRLERLPDYVGLLESDAGQALLREAAKRAAVARREAVRT
jgi:hypothetical protein